MYPGDPVEQILCQRVSQLVDSDVDHPKVALKFPVQRATPEQRQNLVPGNECSPAAADRGQLSDRPTVNGNSHAFAVFDRAEHLTYAVAQLALRNGLHAV